MKRPQIRYIAILDDQGRVWSWADHDFQGLSLALEFVAGKTSWTLNLVDTIPIVDPAYRV